MARAARCWAGNELQAASWDASESNLVVQQGGCACGLCACYTSINVTDIACSIPLALPNSVVNLECETPAYL